MEITKYSAEFSFLLHKSNKNEIKVLEINAT